MLDGLRRKLALSLFVRSGWGQELQRHTNGVFEGSLLRDFSAKAKREHAEALYLRVMEIDRQADRFATFRQEIASAGLLYSELSVLTLKPEECIELHASPYISGQLHRRIRDAAKYNQMVGRICSRVSSDEDLYWAMQSQTVLSLYWVNGFNLLRAKYEPHNVDVNPNWFRPFVRSMMIWSEWVHRSNLGLPQLCDDARALQHSTLANFVSDGEANPLTAWEAHYGLKHDEVS